MRLLRSVPAMLASLFLGSTAAAGQQQSQTASPSINDTIPFTPFAEPSYFWIGMPHGALYDADVRIPLALWSQTGNLKDPDRRRMEAEGQPADVSSDDPGISRPTRASGYTIFFIPHFGIRQLSGGSAPVRTPTFNPGFEYTRYWMRLEPKAQALSRSSIRGGASRIGMVYATHIRLAHYSNGQSGCFYKEQAGDECFTSGPPATSLNTYDGSFSTHYLEGGGTAARIGFNSSGKERQTFLLSESVRWNFPRFASVGGMNGELARAYGRVSVAAQARARFRTTAAVHTFATEVEYRVNRNRQYNPWRGSATYSLTFPAAYGFGLALRYSAGWDHYNMGFGSDVRNPRGGWPAVGLTFDHTLPISIRR